MEHSKKNNYDYVKKIELKRKIEKIKKTDYLVDIYKIIAAETKDLTINDNGVFILFHNLSNETYEKLDKYVSNIYNIHKIKSNNTIDTFNSVFNSEISDSYHNSVSNNIDSVHTSDISDSNFDKTLSNKEKMLQRKRDYEKYLNCNQN